MYNFEVKFKRQNKNHILLHIQNTIFTDLRFILNNMSSYEVIVLFNGYSNTKGNYMEANCTCTLIKGPLNVIVDTMTAWDGDKITEALKRNAVNLEDIAFVVCTHGHSDHIGCNYLFPKATHIVGFSISHKDKYLDHDFSAGNEYVIDENIKVIPTPGHTMQDVSVIVKIKNNETIALTGDLFEKQEDLLDESIWKNAGSDSEQLQIKNRKNILNIADWIVPGHGPMFKVTKTY